MRNFAFFSVAAAALAVAQSDDVTETAPPMGVYKTEIYQPLVTATTIAIEDSVSIATAAPVANEKRDVSCVAQPTGVQHPTAGVLDSAAGFLADAYYPAQASAAVLPSGYSSIYVNSQASNNADNYMGYTLMSTYDVKSCGDKCNAMAGCSSFNIYFERDPSVNPDSASCASPAGVTQIKCVWWGGIIDQNTNVNSGQWRNQFQVVIAGSNAYVNKASAAIAGTAVSSANAAATTVASATSNYAIYFSSDSTVGSFSNAQASASYADCTTACDNTATCTAFTYVGGTNGVGSGTCWLKTSLGSPSKSGSNVVSGVKVAAAAANKAVTTSTTSATSSAVPTSTTTTSTTSSAVPTSTTTTSTTSSAVPKSTTTTSTTSSAVPTSTTTTSTTSSTVPTSTTSTPPVTSSKASSITSSTPTSTTMITSIKTSSTTTSSATTSSTTTSTSTTSTTTSSSPAVTTGAPFYMKIGAYRTAPAAQWAAVASGANGAVTLNGGDLSGATKFAYDSTGKMVIYGTTNAANVQSTDGSYRGLVANPNSQNLPFIYCGGDDIIGCSANNVGQTAVVCTADNYKTLYFGSNSVPDNCFWVGLYKFDV